jgi:hypothetical protein
MQKNTVEGGYPSTVLLFHCRHMITLNKMKVIFHEN